MHRYAWLCLIPFLAACQGGARPESPTAASTPTPTPAPAPEPMARYLVRFDATWSAATHPQEAPPNPHFSGLIGGTHGAGMSFWSAGELATEGIRRMAELGSQSPLDVEVLAAIDAGTAQYLLAGDGVPRSPGVAELTFEIGREYSLVSLVTMVAPSPDWFVGVSGVSLIEGGSWVDELVVELRPYDAGTDSGMSFRSPDEETFPHEPVRMIAEAPLAVGGTVLPLGTFSFRRVE